MSKSTTKKSKQSKKSAIPLWAGWNNYFKSPEGLSAITSVVNGVASIVAGRYAWQRRHNGQPEPTAPISGADAPDQVAVEMICLDPRLAAFIPSDVRGSVGDMDAAVALVRLRDQDGVPECDEEVRNAVYAAVALMSHGITQSRNSYTGGSDECDLNETVMYGIADDSNPIPPDEIESAESALDEDEVEAVCDQYGIRSDFFFNFCSDSGAGDGSGYWTNEFVVRLMPEFSAGIEEGEFCEYDCDRCGEGQSSCTCVYDEEEGDYITKEEAEEKAKLKAEAEVADGDTGAQGAE